MSGQLQSQIKFPAKRDFAPARTDLLQRKCACGTHTLSGECEECKKEKSQLQRASLSPRGRGIEGEGAVPPIVHEVVRSPGQPLDPATRAFMEPRFGHDFSQVRVHTDAKAAESARAVNARAYTVQQHVAFGVGLYLPATDVGRRLLAHELTHTIQHQPGEVSQLKLTDSPAHEHDADAAADDVLCRRPIPPLRPLNSNSVSRQKLNPDEPLKIERDFEVEPRLIPMNAPAVKEVEKRDDAELRHLAMLPHLALKQWRTLTHSERDQVLRYMILLYGPPFASEFLLYAKGIKKPRPGFGGVLKGFHYTPKWLFDHGYRHAYGETWVHPSGEYIWFLGSSTKGPPQPPPPPEPPCDTDDCFNKDDEDSCNECCEEKFPDEDSHCRRQCDARCAMKL